jgi:hypothetical protein
VLLKKLIYACLACFLFLGCTATDPELSDTYITDDTVVAGQRVLAHVYSVTDNPPMTYTWTATGGTLEENEQAPYSVYWTAPDTAGSYAVTCTVEDSDDNRSSHTFTVEVSPRVLEQDLAGADNSVITLTKQSDSNLGGVWVSVRDGMLRFISTQANEESVWGKNFFTMLGRIDSATGLYTLWGVDAPGSGITVLTGSTENTLTCETCFNNAFINALALDVVYDDTILWVGTSNGLSTYDATSDTWTNYMPIQVNALAEGPDYVYAASESGLYRLTGYAKTPLFEGNTTAVLALDRGESITGIWSVVQGTSGRQVCYGSVEMLLSNTFGNVVHEPSIPLAAQPQTVADSLDVDRAGNIWCGKYWWDGSAWHVVPGLETVTITRSVVSTEGLVYLLSDSGVLYRW